MPDASPSLPAVPKYPGLRPFNSQTARAAQQRREQLKRDRERLANMPETIPTQCERLALVIEQIALTRKALNNGCDPKERAMLLRALCALLDRERILRGEPLPGSRKPAPERRPESRAPSSPVPVAPAPTPQEPPACGVQPTTCSVQEQSSETPKTTSPQVPEA